MRLETEGRCWRGSSPPGPGALMVPGLRRGLFFGEEALDQAVAWTRGGCGWPRQTTCASAQSEQRPILAAALLVDEAALALGADDLPLALRLCKTNRTTCCLINEQGQLMKTIRYAEQGLSHAKLKYLLIGLFCHHHSHFC
jgi:hypothetical protein